MTAAHLRFQVDSRLASLLSQEYPSSEKALKELKELVDNAWDADAEWVAIALPKPMSGDPIVIEDDGTGMTEEECFEEQHPGEERYSHPAPAHCREWY